jgi:DNA-binding transcriptional LysR family regulator
MIQMNELEAVVALARARSFRAAAIEISSSCSAVSHAIASLERRLGVRLFHRSTRSVSLTDAGRTFIEGIGPALSAIRQTVDEVGAQHQGLSGTIRLNTFADAARWILDPIILEFLRRHPAMHVDLVTEGRMVDIIDAGFDAGVRFAEMVPQDMISVPTGCRLPFVTVASPAYIESHDRPSEPADLSDHLCIQNRMPDGRLAPWAFKGRTKVASPDLKGALTLDEPFLIRQAAVAGMGIAHLPLSHVADDLRAGRLATMLDDWAAKPSELCFYYSGRRHVPRGLRALLDLVKESRVRSSIPARISES